MKTPYLLGQKILCIISTTVLGGCVIGDAVALLMKFEANSDWVFVVNLLLSLIAMAVFITLIRKPELTGVVPKPYNDSSITVLSATRTYICIVYLDVALIMGLVVFGTSLIPDFQLSISIIGVAAIVFIISAVNYIFDCRRINSGKDTAAKDPSPQEETPASAENDDISNQKGS